MGAAAPPAQSATLDQTRGLDDAGGERAARIDLRRQIEQLERELAQAFVAAFELRATLSGARAPFPRGAQPRLLSLGELEATRDDLVTQLHARRLEIAARVAEQHRARAQLAQMLADPAGHRLKRITCRELGEPGCGAWEVRPRLGLIGMLMGWWQVTLSSGCPLCRTTLSCRLG